MKNKAILFELIELLELFEQENSNNKTAMTTSDFLYFLVDRSHYGFKRDELSGGVEDWRDKHTPQDELNTDISILVVMLFRYAKAYIKKALENSSIKSADDFSFLITLLTYPSMSKMELTSMQVMEKTSGNEIINRLIREDFISQTKDTHDKRKVQIKLTEKGRQEIFSVLPNMKLVSEIIVGNLTGQEIKTFAFLLRKLDKFHSQHYEKAKTKNLKDLLP